VVESRGERAERRGKMEWQSSWTDPFQQYLILNCFLCGKIEEQEKERMDGEDLSIEKGGLPLLRW